MLSSPSSPPRTALVNFTNTYARDDSESASLPGVSDRKRSLVAADEREKKRAKLANAIPIDSSCSEESDSDLDTEDGVAVQARARKRMTFNLTNSVMMGHSSISTWNHSIPTRPILQTFVSSHKADVFKCQSMENSYLTVPYTCAYSNGAKRGGLPLLAIATEQGAVHIVNTTKRRDWDYEPQRTVFSPHMNGIFDAKWSPSDTLLATVSGDQSIRISSLASSVLSENRVLHTLRGHGSTVKCIAWDPTKDGDILSTGGRDGGICVWDLRVSEGRGRRAADQNGASNSSPESIPIAPVIVIPGAHEVDGKPRKPKGRKGKLAPAAPLRSITSLVYPEDSSTCLVSSGSYDGILRRWDLRLPSNTTTKKSVKTSKAPPKPIWVSSTDPTTLQGTRRARGITSLAPGHGPSAGFLFALGTDSRVHTYTLPTLEPLSGYNLASGADEDPWVYSHADMQTNSFYVRLALSPCGRWLANGSASDGRVFLFDVGSTASARRALAEGSKCANARAVELRGQTGEIGALDWAQDMLATCADDSTVRIWRPDADVYRRCLVDSEKMSWDWSWTPSA